MLHLMLQPFDVCTFWIYVEFIVDHIETWFYNRSVNRELHNHSDNSYYFN